MKAIPFESYEVFRSVCSSQAPAFDADLCSIVVNATRYSLGRRTYMPSVVSDFIKRHISQLDDETLNRVISIVREYLNGEPQDPEISVWYSLLHTLSRWILEKSSRSDSAMMTLPEIETLERIDQKQTGNYDRQYKNTENDFIFCYFSSHFAHDSVPSIRLTRSFLHENSFT